MKFDSLGSIIAVLVLLIAVVLTAIGRVPLEVGALIAALAIARLVP